MSAGSDLPRTATPDAPSAGGKSEHALAAASALLLFALLAVLPESEALKTGAVIGFVAVTAAWMAVARRAFRPDALDLCLIGYAAVPFVTRFTSTLGAESPVGKGSTWIMIAAVGMAIRRAPLSSGDVRIALRTIVAGTLVSLAIGAIRPNDHPFETWVALRSVGHINQVALYLVPALAAAATCVLLDRGRWRMAAIAAIAVLLWAMYRTDSVIGLAATAGLAGAVVVSSPLSRTARAGLLVLASVGAAAAVLLFPPTRVLLSADSLDGMSSARLRILRTALALFRENPLFGTGPTSFDLASREDRLRAAVEASGATFDPDRYFIACSHGHGLFPNVLVERGLAGVALMAGILVLWSAKLCRGPGPVRMLWLGGLAYALVGGLGNSTMAFEHGLLAVACWALAERLLPAADRR